MNIKDLKTKLIFCVFCGLFAISSVGGCSVNQKDTENAAVISAGVDQREDNLKQFDAGAYYDRLMNCVKQIRKRSDFKPDVVLVLGSGLGDYAEKLDIVAKIPYADIKGWPNSTVEDHAGNLVFAKMNGLNVAVMQGRVHYYEGYSMYDVVLPLRVLHLIGAKTVILTNAVGAINKDYKVGDFVVVKDHISSFVPSPLIGENIDKLGRRFTGMTFVYDKKLRNAVLEIGKKEKITVHSGVFIQVTGPQFETPAEIRMYRNLGADTVSMSSAVEAIAAAHMGMRVAMINCVTNMAAGITGKELTPGEVSEQAVRSAKDFEKLITSLLKRIKPRG